MKRFVLGIIALIALASLAVTLPAQQAPKTNLQALSQGDVRIIAQWMVGNSFKASTTLVHVQPLALWSITPQVPTTMTVGQSFCPIAIGRDSLGGFVTGVPVKWSSSDTTVLKIGGATLVCPMSDTTVKSGVPVIVLKPPMELMLRTR